MKNIIFSIAIILLFSSNCVPQKMGDAYRLFINKINLPLDRSGIIADVNIPSEGTLGRFEESSFLFSGGFFLSGYSDGTLWANAVASASLVEDYIPGVVGNQVNASMYVVKNTDPQGGLSYQDWADAVAIGADFYDVDGDAVYNSNIDIPDILGDETVWCVYNDGVPSANRRWNAVALIGIEIRQTVFAYNADTWSLYNIIFIRYRIKYTGLGNPGEPNKLDNIYFGLWDDPDIGSSYQTYLTGCDTILNACFTYKAGSDPGGYGNNPPSFFVDLLSGPVEYIPGETFIDIDGDGEYTEGIDTPLDTAYSVRGTNIGIIEYPGARNQTLSSFVEYFNGFSDPYLNDPNDHVQARNYMLGLKSNGEAVNPCNFSVGEVHGGVDCNTVDPRFWFSGDPVTDMGWIGIQPWDVRQMANTGPFTLWKDTQENREAGRLIEKEIFAAYVVGRGVDRLNSITIARDISAMAHQVFDYNFPVITDIKEAESHPLNYSLSQNYPNPFNPSTTIKFSLPNSDYVTINIYNALGEEVAVLLNEKKEPGYHQVEFNAGHLPSGIYFYQLQAGDFIETKKMILMK